MQNKLQELTDKLYNEGLSKESRKAKNFLPRLKYRLRISSPRLRPRLNVS